MIVRRMNAPPNISVTIADREAQALTARCREKRWRLLQQFGCLEIALKRRLKNPPKTFGSKIRAWIKEDPSAKQFERLIPARNLLAHAFVQCVQSDGVMYALWEIADDPGDLNCAKFDNDALTEWTNELLQLLEAAIASAGVH